MRGFIKTVLRNEGFSAKRTRGSGDFGVDVLASKNGKTFAIQCKLYNRTVGTKSVQEVVSGRIFYKTDFAIVVSDNIFTEAAKVLARKSEVLLTHHRNLLHILESLAPSDEETQDSIKPDKPAGDRAKQDSPKPMAKKQPTQNDMDELIALILPTIRNG